MAAGVLVAGYDNKMLIFILLVLSVIVITYVYVRWIRLKQFWLKKRIPFIPTHPVFGSLSFIQRENPAPWFRRIYEQFKEPYVGLWIFWRPGLLINSESLARNILIRDQANFRNRFASSGTTDPVGRLNMFTLDDPLWSVIRRRLTILFTGSKLRGIQNLITQKSKELVERIDKDRQKSEPINLRVMMTDFSTDIIGTSAFGVVSDATITGESEIRTITEGYMKYELFRALSWCCIFFIPELVDWFRFKMFPTATTEYLRKVMRLIIAQRGGLENKVTEPKDLLDILIKIRQEGDEDLDMNEDMMLAQAAILLQAGFETSALTLSFAIYELAFYPEAQVKLYEELRQAKDKHGDNLLDVNTLCQLTYLNCVIDETFRKYPVLPVLDRVALNDYKVDDHLTIEAGTPVMVNVIGLHYDPEFYAEPDRFDPDRFLPENEPDVKPFAFMPFGEGPRKCIGQRFGHSTVRHGLAATMLNYEVRPLPNTPKPSEVNLDKFTLFVAPGDVLSVEFVPRN